MNSLTPRMPTLITKRLYLVIRGLRAEKPQIRVVRPSVLTNLRPSLVRFFPYLIWPGSLLARKRSGVRISQEIFRSLMGNIN